MVTEFTLSRKEFLAKMREYSKSNQGIAYPVEANAWRTMKRQLVENEDCVEVSVEVNCIHIRAYETIYHYSTLDTANLDKFIYYLRSTYNMATHNFCNCVSDATSALNTLTTSLGDLPIGVQTGYADISTSNVIKSSDYISTVSTTDWLCGTTNNLDHRITLLEKTVNDMTKKEEKKDMDKMFNFDFGKVASDAVRVSMYGIAVKSVDGRYVSYDTKSHSVMDVDIVNMPAGDFLYKMPVAIKDVKAGDVVIHNRTPMFVVEVHDSTLKVVDVREGTEKEIYLTKNMFNFNFATKVVSVMDMMGAEMKPSADQPFGNPIMMMMLMGSEKMDDMLPLMLMNGNTAMNPMMMYLLMSNKDSKMDPMLMLAMMNMGTSK